ncbi:MAG: sugar phosphate isomerase/epimerase [Bryobacteraceae bacterium]|nr:sugar phosphate isomerase/epimerase [Bryobacteraceae bacterium]
MRQTEPDIPSRRAFLALGASAAAGLPRMLRAARKHVPIGLELYSVRDHVKKDVNDAVRQVAKIGYEVVENYSIYFDYTPEQARLLRKTMDEVKIRCVSTHNSDKALLPENLSRTVELNQALGSKHVILASAGRVTTAKGWHEVAEKLNQASERFKPHGMRTGFHNHGEEFKPVDGKIPMDILGQDTSKDVILQLDVGAALSVGADPIAFMKKYPGRTASMHVKDWSPDPSKGFEVLLGEGAAKWKEIFDVAESVGGIEYYFIEQEGSAYPPMETVERCLKAMRRIRA